MSFIDFIMVVRTLLPGREKNKLISFSRVRDMRRYLCTRNPVILYIN